MCSGNEENKTQHHCEKQSASAQEINQQKKTSTSLQNKLACFIFFLVNAFLMFYDISSLLALIHLNCALLSNMKHWKKGNRYKDNVYHKKMTRIIDEM